MLTCKLKVVECLATSVLVADHTGEEGLNESEDLLPEQPRREHAAGTCFRDRGTHNGTLPYQLLRRSGKPYRTESLAKVALETRLL